MDNTKFPKSIKKYDCIGPCYEPNTPILHPITLEHVYDSTHPFCPINEPNEIIDGELQLIDRCHKVTVDKNKDYNDDLQMNILFSITNFTSIHFLKLYNIQSTEDAFEWVLNNSHESYYTKRRVLDHMWDSYGFNDFIIDNRIAVVYLHMFKKKALPEFYKKIYKYITIKDGNINISKNNDDIQDNKVEKINYIMDKFINEKNFSKFINEYIKVFKDDELDSHSDNILKEFSIYIEQKIKVTLK